jgi:hypothetical protein
MQMLTIAAASPQSARALVDALSEFQVELLERKYGRRDIVVELGGSDREIIDVLSAIEAYVTQRRDGPARIELNGRSYTMHAESHALEDDVEALDL